MRIVIDARLYGLENTGIGRYLINLIENLRDDEDNEYVILLRKKYFNKLKSGKNIEKVLVDIPHYGFLEQLKLPLVLNRIKKDLVHFPHFNIPMFWNGKFVVTIHDMTMHLRGKDASKLSPLTYLTKKIAYKMVFSKAVKKSKSVIVPSKSVKNDLVDYFEIKKNKVNVIYEGLAELKKGKVDVLKKYNLKEKGYFLYIGNTFPYKNVSRLIEAISILKKSNEEVKLVIGSPHDVFTKKILEEAKSLGVEKNIFHIGYVPDDEMVSLYKNSLAFVYPSLAEGFGLQGLEAINSGTLLAASAIPVFKEVYEEVPFYFDPKQANSIVLSLEKLMNLNGSERQKRIDSSKNLLKKYSWEKMAKETIEVYQKA